MNYSHFLRIALFCFFLVPSVTFAQETCGDIIIESFGDTEITPIADCDDPFQETIDPLISNVTQSVNEIALPTNETISSWAGPADLLLETAVEFADQPVDVFVNLGLFRVDGDDYVNVLNTFGTELRIQNFEPGEYVVLTEVEVVPVVSQNQTPLQKLRSLIVPTAHAQFSPVALARVANRFTYIDGTIEPECGSLVSVDENGNELSREIIQDCTNPFAEIDGDIVFNPILDLMQEPFIDLGEGSVVPVDSLPADVSFSARWSVAAGTPPLDREAVLYQHATSGDYVSYPSDPNDLLYFVPEAGIYTLVSTWFQDDENGDPEVVERLAVTFTIEEINPEPQGASSVLFLPGIQASRLYTDGLLGTEDQIWTPTNAFSQDVRQLEMNLTGQSVNNIYTRDVLDTIADRDPVYQGLLNYFSDLEDANQISAFEPFAYDWRFTPNTIVQRGTAYEVGVVDLIRIVDVLAEQATNDKVSIVAHSNGGLVAKALVVELEKRNKEELIDQIIFIGTPHIGTPKAIGTVLHGYDQAKDLLKIPIIEADVAREVINNMPGAYGLLPSPAYFSAFGQPIIGIQNATTTSELFEAYGPTIDSYGEFTNFLRGQDELDRNLNNSLSIPAPINQSLYQQAVNEHIDLLDAWQAPDNIEVTQIVGVGLPTLSLIEYREVIETDCGAVVNGQPVCILAQFLRPFGYFSNDGDETVMSLSAEAYAGDSDVFYVDMGQTRLTHYNMAEDQEILELVGSTLLATTSEYTYISSNKPEITTNFDIEALDSPLRALATDSAGNRTGVIEENGELSVVTEIPASQYFEFAGTKYLIIPSEIERETVLTGEADGGYTLTLATLGSDNQTEINSVLVNATVTPEMRVTYQKTSDGYSTLVTDFDGDGVVDLETTTNGEVISSPEMVTYDSLRSAINSLDLPRNKGRILHKLVNRAEQFAEKDKQRLERRILKLVDRILYFYKRSGLISREEYREVHGIVKELRK